MTRIRIRLIAAVVWFAVIFNAGRIQINGQSLDIDAAVYLISALIGIAMLSFPNLTRQRLSISIAGVAAVYSALHLFPGFGWEEKEFYMFLIEAAAPIATLMLMRWIGHALIEFEMATEAFVLGSDQMRLMQHAEGEELVNHELYRARRFERPVALVYCSVPEGVVSEEETLIKTDFISWRVTKSFKRRYQQVQLARAVASLTYKSDILVEGKNGVVVCLPETNGEEAKAFVRQLSIFMQDTAHFEPLVGIAAFPEQGLTFEDLVEIAERNAVLASKIEEKEDVWPHSQNGGGKGDVQVDLDERLKIERDATWVNKLAYQSTSARAIYGVIKRAFDIMVVLSVLLAVMPVLLIVALMVYIDDGAPIFYMQWRTGYGGKRFKMFKFRTMYANAGSIPPTEVRMPNGEIRYEWPEKMENDPRITRVGRFLRKSSLDELPQLLNVLKGDMSLVGPRPTSWNLDMYTLHQTERLTVRPGITGLWQVSARETTNPDERLIWDMKYIDKMSLWLDAQILWRTFAQVFKKGGI
jgi:lipopolysaccharide/colanic/teichoic acid biosynthesis glycosyltransferase